MKSWTVKNTMLLLLLMMMLFSGCVPNDYLKGMAEDMNKEPLVMRITWKTYSGRGEAIQEIVETYNAMNENHLKVQLADGDEDLAVIETLLNKNSNVDIFVLPYRYIKYFGNHSQLLDLTSEFQAEKDYFYPNLWGLGVINQKTYGIPWLGHSICLLYNKTLLQKAGVDPETIKSVNDLATACAKVEEGTEAKGIGLVGANHNDISWMVNQFIYGFGSSLVDSNGTTVTINNGKSIAAIDFYKNTLGKYAQDTWKEDSGVEVMDYFREQQVAFEFQGVWGVTDIWKNGNPFKVGVIRLDDIGLLPEIGPMMLALPSNLSPDRKEEAICFIRYLISKEAQENILKGEYSPEHEAYYPFRIPVRNDLQDSDFFQLYPEFLSFSEGFKSPSIDVPVPQWQKIKDQYYAPGLHRVMKGELATEELLQTMEIEGNKILSEQENRR